MVKVVRDGPFDCLDMVVVKVVVLRVVIRKKIGPVFSRKSLLVVRGMEFTIVAVSKVMCLLFSVDVQFPYSFLKGSGVFVYVEVRDQLVLSVLL